MVNNNIKKLKKYLFLISIIFLIISLIHLLYIYLYNDSKLVPVKGGAVSEGIIGKFPSLNPLKPLNGNNKYIIELLYRSILTYDLEENKIASDLASCDISNLLKIECYLKDNIFWSNGEEITSDDIVSTYKILQTTGVNKVLSSLLENTEITQNGNIITFKNTNKDINFLNIFFQPILSKKIIDSIGNDTIFGNFPSSGQVYSGDFIISNISSDLTIGITKIFLDRNPYNNNGNISKLIIKIFPNINSFLQNKGSINIFNDSENIVGNSIPRLQSNQYTLSQYVSLFVNKETVPDIKLRTFILNSINVDSLIKSIGENNYKKVINPYLTETSIANESKNYNIETILNDLGYIKKDKLLKKYTPLKQIYSEEVSIKEIKKEIKIPEDIDLKLFQKKSNFIVSPNYVEKYNFVTKDDILLKGLAGKNIESIYVNDYKLRSYKSGNKYFYYRLKESFKSIDEGLNSYKIYFIENGKKVFKEEIFFLYHKDKPTLNKETGKLLSKLYLDKKENELSKIEIKKDDIKKKKEDIVLNKKFLDDLSKLNQDFYYNDKLDYFSLNLYYIGSDKKLEETAYFIKESLLKAGIDIILIPIPMSKLSEILSKKENYNLLLTGVNLGYFDFNIFPYFHSSQANNGYNFSNIKRTSLDILLEDLKVGIKSSDKVSKIKEQVLKILKKEELVKTLYTPKINLLIDKNIKNIPIKKQLIFKSDRNYIYNTIYIKDNKIINLANKSFIGFFNFLFKKLND